MGSVYLVELDVVIFDHLMVGPIVPKDLILTLGILQGSGTGKEDLSIPFGEEESINDLDYWPCGVS